MFSPASTIITQGIRVSVRSLYMRDESSPAHFYHYFAYQVKIVNESSDPVKLLRRHWFITDGVGGKREVEGDGVIGKQPVLRPGEFHEYVSGCDFQTPVGKMEGYYNMLRLTDGSEFKAQIPPFVMILPILLN